jgi:hypothetical protein
MGISRLSVRGTGAGSGDDVASVILRTWRICINGGRLRRNLRAILFRVGTEPRALAASSGLAPWSMGRGLLGLVGLGTCLVPDPSLIAGTVG